jgi:large subunit ribosomal protein L25
VPAVVYGHGSDPQHITLPGHDLMLALKTANVLLELDLGGGVELTLPKSIQRDPVKQTLEHVDLVIVKRGEKVSVEVPLVATGKVPGGLLDLVHATINVEAEATHIPTEITVDVEGLEIGAAVTAGELTLPSGATLLLDPDTVVVHVMAPQAEEEAVPAEAEGEGAEAAPAAEAAETAEAASES